MPIITGRTPSGDIRDVAIDEEGKLRLSGTVPISGDIEVVSSNLLEGYKLADMETGGETEYYGYTDKDENWYIMQLTTTASRYCSGAAGYAAAWIARVPPGQTYLYYHEVF